MPAGDNTPGWDIRRLFSPPQPSRTNGGEPQTDAQQPAHATPANPTPVILEDMSAHGGAASADEARQANPSARDTMQSASDVHIAGTDASLAEQGKHGKDASGATKAGSDQPAQDNVGVEPDQLKANIEEFYEQHPRAREFMEYVDSGFAEDPSILRGILNNERNLASTLHTLIAMDQGLESAAELKDVPSFFVLEVFASFQRMLKTFQIPYEINTTLLFRPLADPPPGPPSTPSKLGETPPPSQAPAGNLKSLTPEMHNEIESMVNRLVLERGGAAPESVRSTGPAVSSRIPPSRISPNLAASPNLGVFPNLGASARGPQPATAPRATGYHISTDASDTGTGAHLSGPLLSPGLSEADRLSRTAPVLRMGAPLWYFVPEGDVPEVALPPWSHSFVSSIPASMVAAKTLLKQSGQHADRIASFALTALSNPALYP